MNKIRVKFRKYGALKFIGHLDVMRYFQKAVRRAEIDVCYSEGFSPHMKMSFAAPLGLGITSDGEYMDLIVKESPSSEEALRRLNAVMAEGIEVLSWRRLPENSKNAMSIVAAADYEVRFRPGYEPSAHWEERFQEFVSQPEISVIKETKKYEQIVDIRPWIYACQVKDGVISLKIAAGSVHNLKPELLLQAFCGQEAVALTPAALLIHRVELYAEQETEDGNRLIALEDLGENIG